MLAPRHVAILAVLVAGSACGGGPSTPDAPRPTTLYVSPAGSDRAAGTIDAPWGTLRHAITELRPGDTLYLRGGVYTGPDNTIDSARRTVPRGTSSSAITIAGYPGEVAIIRPPADLHAIRLTIGAPSYLIFQDLIIDMENSPSGGAEPEGIYLSDGANHNRFQRLEVRNAKSFGIVFSKNNGNSGSNEVLNCKVYGTGNGSGDPRNGHGFYISTSDNRIEGNEVFDNAGYGIHLYDDLGPKFVARNVVRGNTIYQNGGGRSSTYGIVVTWGDGNVIAENTIYSNPGGILVFVDSTNAEVVGNTIHSNVPREGILVDLASGTTVRNNVLFGNGLGIVDRGTGTLLSGNSTAP